MTIQPSILLWTVITFCLTVFVLNRFLFGPMLAFMDKRQEKIDRAAARKVENARLLAEAEEKLEQFRREEDKHLTELAASALTNARHDAETLITVTHRKQNQKLDLHVADLETESKEIEKVLDTQLDDMAKCYADTLLS